MKLITLAAALCLAPAFAFALGCHGDHERTTAASCPAGQTWDAGTSSCVDQASS